MLEPHPADRQSEVSCANERYRSFSFEAAKPSMPGGVRRSTASVLSPPNLAPEVAGAVSWPGERPASPEVELLRHVLASAGLNPDLYRLPPLMRRIPACLRVLRVADCREGLQRLKGDSQLLFAALNVLLIGVTNFYRDGATFRQLREKVIPELLAAREQVRVWSAACSNGDELYSVAMLFGERGALSRAVFRGTDCRASAIEAAQRGEYAASALEGLPAELSGRFFQQEGQICRICDELRALPAWEVADVLSPGAEDPETWDLVLCRNLVIYLAPAAVAGLWRKLSDCLAPGGVLVAGKAEVPTTPGLQRIGPCLFRKVAK